jgi:hypothetical protein|tara:strand:- start:2995 stop:3390 length:396 start_codon:yes stop_codon:yes gene_type:complete
MADTANTQVLRNGPRDYVANFTYEYNDTGESAVKKVDISALTDANGATATYSAIDRIDYDVSTGMTVAVEFDATANDEIAVLFGQGTFDWTDLGGLVDPKSAGTTGDIKFTTVGHAAGDTYTITLYIRPKA